MGVNNMKVVNIYESKLYGEDTDFDCEEAKDEYYAGEFWQDCDYLYEDKEDDNPVMFVIMGDEVIVREYDDCSYEDLLLKFAGDNYEDYFEEMTIGNHFRLEENESYDPSKPFIKYRGGSGYWYAHHQYRG